MNVHDSVVRAHKIADAVVEHPPTVDPPRKNNAPQKDLRREAEAWIAGNPHVYELFMRFSRELLAAGLKRFGISLITERVRWEVAISTRSDDGYRINNNHRPYIARKLIEDYPTLGGVLQLRQTSY